MTNYKQTRNARVIPVEDCNMHRTNLAEVYHNYSMNKARTKHIYIRIKA